MKLSDNFTLEELIRTNHLGIDNKPSMDVKAYLLELCLLILQPIRDKYGKPIIVTSGYRCKKLNEKVKGSKTSQHLKGQAADIKCDDNRKLFELIKKMIDDKDIEVGQLIDEYDYSWIHISLPTENKKNQILHLK